MGLRSRLTAAFISFSCCKFRPMHSRVRRRDSARGLLPLPARALLLAPALHGQLRLEVGDAAVLGGEAGDGAVAAGADVAAVFDQALLLAAAHLQDNLG